MPIDVSDTRLLLKAIITACTSNKNERVCACGVKYTIGRRQGGGYQPYKCNCVGKPPRER